MLVVCTSLYTTIAKIFYTRSWKLSIITALSAGILFIIFDSLCRYFGLY